MKKLYTKTLLLRLSGDMDKAIRRSAKQKKMEIATFCRGALASAIAKEENKKCACGLHWGHTGKHSR